MPPRHTHPPLTIMHLLCSVHVLTLERFIPLKKRKKTTTQKPRLEGCYHLEEKTLPRNHESHRDDLNLIPDLIYSGTRCCPLFIKTYDFITLLHYYTSTVCAHLARTAL